MILNELKTKKIAILGFGNEGMSTFKFFRQNGIKVTAVLDKAPELDSIQKQLIEDVKYVCGENYLDGLSEYDVLMRSPGLPRFHPKLISYKDQSQIYSHIKLFFDLSPCPIVAVTGTKGKTTTTSLIYEILKTGGKKVFLGGNIGVPPLEFLSQLTDDSIVVLEISSFQAIDLQKSPHIGVILNVTHDHLDDGSFRPASHSSEEEYLNAKAQLIANQGPEDFAILNQNLGEIFTNSGNATKIAYRSEDAKNYQTKLLGKHNLENIAAAVKVAEVLKLGNELIAKAVAEFPGVTYRLQLIGEKNGIQYVNDSASSNPDSTIAAIDAFEKGIVLVVGGSDKQLDYSELANKIINSPQVKGIVVIGQVATKILSLLPDIKKTITTGAKNMKEIIEQANSIASPGDVVLLSPAAASFDMFKNYKDRGDQFNQEVMNL